MKRLYVGWLLSPLWVPFFATIVGASTPPPAFMRGMSSGSWLLGATVVGAIAGYIGAIAIGLPAHLFLRRRSSSIWAYLTLWFSVALAAWVAVFLAGFASYGMLFSLEYLAETIVHRPYAPLATGAIWALVGGTFWLIVRPDKQASSFPETNVNSQGQQGPDPSVALPKVASPKPVPDRLSRN